MAGEGQSRSSVGFITGQGRLEAGYNVDLGSLIVEVAFDADERVIQIIAHKIGDRDIAISTDRIKSDQSCQELGVRKNPAHGRLS